MALHNLSNNNLIYYYGVITIMLSILVSLNLKIIKYQIIIVLRYSKSNLSTGVRIK